MAESESDRVLVFSLDGTFLRSWHMPTICHAGSTSAIAASDFGEIFVSHNPFRICVFSPDGVLIREMETDFICASLGVSRTGVVVGCDFAGNIATFQDCS